MKRLLLVMLLVFGVGIHAAAPTLRYDASRESPFTIAFDAGQFAACTVYASLTETIELDGKVVPYAPRHCGTLAGGLRQTSYVDDWSFIEPTGGSWDVWAELYDEDGVETRTNVIRLVH